MLHIPDVSIFISKIKAVSYIYNEYVYIALCLRSYLEMQSGIGEERTKSSEISFQVPA